MSKVEKAVSFMEGIARDDSHGYSQINRWGPDYDCSSLVITAFDQAGFPVKSYGASYTGNMRQAFLRAGFEDITSKVNVYNANGMKRGDILLNTTYHTAVYCGNGKMVHASRDEAFGVQGRLKGDQDQKEICIAPYANYHRGWNCVMRFNEVAETPTPAQPQYKVEQNEFVFNGNKVVMNRILHAQQNFVQVQALLKNGIISQNEYLAISNTADKRFTTILVNDLRYVKLVDLAAAGFMKVEWDAATKTVRIIK